MTLGIGGLRWGMWGWVLGLGCVFWACAGLFCGFGGMVTGLGLMAFGRDFWVWGGQVDLCGLPDCVWGIGGLCRGMGG